MKIAQADSRRAPIIVIFGAEGRGKTTLASKFPEALFVLLERGLPRGIVVDAIQDIGTFPQLMDALRELYAAETTYKTLVIDTIDMLEAMLIEAVCVEHHWPTIETPSFGKGWVAADVAWRKFLRAISALRDRHNMTIVLVAHSAVERVEDPRAPSFTQYGLRLHRRARALVLDAADVVGFLADDLRVVTEDTGFNRERTRAAASPTRYLFVEGTPAFTAKNRYGLPAKIEVPLDFDMPTFMSYFTQPPTQGDPTNG